MIRRTLPVLFLVFVIFLACKPEPPDVVIHNACPGYTKLRGITFPTSGAQRILDSLGLKSSVSDADPKLSYQVDTRIIIHPRDRRWLHGLNSAFPNAEIDQTPQRGTIHVWVGINGLAFDSLPFSRRMLVLNGTAKAGLARNVAYRFNAHFGLATLEPQTADADTFSKTLLYSSPADSALAKTLIGFLGQGELKVKTNLVDMILITGSDMLSPQTKPKLTSGISLVIKKSIFEMLVYKDGQLIKTYPIATGKNQGDKQRKGDNRTPEGDFTITSIEDSHAWEHDFADDTLGPIKGAYGPWFLGLSTKASETRSGKEWTGIAIHGTHDEASIGTRASEGCIRMYNQDVDSLKRMVKIGTPVRIEE